MKSFYSKFSVSLFALCFVFLLNSCTSDSGDNNKTKTKAEVPKQQTYSVAIAQMKFTPAEISVKKGDTIVFVNLDMVAHDVTEQATKAWTSSPLAPNESWTLVVTKSADYYCSLHEVMKGKIIMQ